METRSWKTEGLNTSLLGFGAMRLPMTEKGNIDTAEATAMLGEAYENGVTYFDTAYTYHNGESEPFLGSFLKQLKRESYQLATKLPQWLVHTLDDAKRLFAEQLQRLQHDYFDFYLIHSIDKAAYVRMVDLGVVAYLEQEQQAGRIKQLGFSFHSIYEDFEYIATSRTWDFCQLQYNYLDTEEQAGDRGYELCTKLDIPVIVMEPIKGGLLANLPPDLEVRLNELNTGASSASYALRWVADHPNVKVILSGMSTMEQVRDNLKTFQSPRRLTERERTTLDSIGQTMRARVGNGCTGCKYCMPCPFGVDIPGNFSLWNKARMFDSYEVVRIQWENPKESSKRPLSCTECGQCVPLCPQHINIPEDLKLVQSELAAKRL
ncbi:MAG: aldo/keto reductase [Spirochaetales bacterium]|nr:aldo/keto reductase [Spirochaetales bacterium]